MADLTLNNIPLEWIRAFEAAGRAGSFTAAAQELNVTQAAIIQRITNLESRLGRPLFIRGARGISLSVDGETWLPYVTTAFGDLSESYEGIFGVQRDKLSISASTSVIEHWLTPRLGNWPTEKRPQIVFSTRVLSTDHQQHDANIRIEYGTGDWLSHHKAPLFQEQISPVAAPKLLSGCADWRTLPRIALSGPRATWQDWTRFTGDPATPVPKLWYDGFAGALFAAIQGEGVLLASLPLCAAHLSQGSLHRLSDKVLETPQTYWMLGHKEDLTKSFWTRACSCFCDP